MASLIALYDSCVLYPAPIRDLFLELALTELFHAKWSADIHAEWIGSVLRDRPDLRLEQLDRTRKLMDTAICDSIVTGYEILFNISPDSVCDAAKSVRMRLQNPPKSAEEYLATLERCGFPHIASQLRHNCNAL